jgi:hypothetical protein
MSYMLSYIVSLIYKYMLDEKSLILGSIFDNVIKQFAIRRIPLIMYVKMSIETRKSMSQTRKNINKALLSH